MTPPRAATPDRPRAWETLGAVAPDALADARRQVHVAAQVVQSHARSLLVALDDDSHAALAWDHEQRALSGRLAHHQRLLLRVEDLTLVMLDEGGEPRGDLALPGHTLEEARDWVRGRMGRNAAAHTLDRPYEIPPHPLHGGGRFALESSAALAELARWFANADLLMHDVAAGIPEAGPVLTWPHHLDTATLLVLDGDGGEGSVTLGLGLSPGDETIPQPYLYAVPWPRPDEDDDLPPVAGPGGWRRKDFTAVVLTGRELLAAARADTTARGEDAAGQQHAARTFLRAGLAACREVLAGVEAAPHLEDDERGFL